MRRLVIVAALAGTLGISAPSPNAIAAPSCGDPVLRDWFDNGRVDRLYRLRCYEDAVAALPPDLRDYSDAEDVIARALQRAARREPASSSPARVEPSSKAFPLLLAGAGMAAALAAAAGLEWRRRIARSSSRSR
jgi:hypothetical protein